MLRGCIVRFVSRGVYRLDLVVGSKEGHPGDGADGGAAAAEPPQLLLKLRVGGPSWRRTAA